MYSYTCIYLNIFANEYEKERRRKKIIYFVEYALISLWPKLNGDRGEKKNTTKEIKLPMGANQTILRNITYFRSDVVISVREST